MKNTLTYLLLLCSFFGISQELHVPVFTQYLADNNFVLSPTFAGIGDNLRIRANGLTQWVGIKDAPQNQSLYGDFRLANRSGIGISVYNDSNGYTSQTGAKFSFAHHIILDYYSKQYLSFGLSYNINSFKIDISKFNTTYEIPIIDPSITDNRAISNNNFDVGLAASFYTSCTGRSNVAQSNKINIKFILPEKTEFTEMFDYNSLMWGMLEKVHLHMKVKKSFVVKVKNTGKEITFEEMTKKTFANYGLVNNTTLMIIYT